MSSNDRAGTFAVAGEIRSIAEEAHSATAYGAGLAFFMTPTGGGSPSGSEKIRIKQDGALIMNSSGSEPATSATSGTIPQLTTVNGRPTGAIAFSTTGAAPILLNRAGRRFGAYLGSAWMESRFDHITPKIRDLGDANGTANDYDGVLLCNPNTVSRTVTLAAVATGGGIWVCNTDDANNVTVQRAGSDTISWGSTSGNTSFSLTPGQCTLLVPDRTSVWRRLGVFSG